MHFTGKNMKKTRIGKFTRSQIGSLECRSIPEIFDEVNDHSIIRLQLSDRTSLGCTEYSGQHTYVVPTYLISSATSWLSLSVLVLRLCRFLLTK